MTDELRAKHLRPPDPAEEILALRATVDDLRRRLEHVERITERARLLEARLERVERIAERARLLEARLPRLERQLETVRQRRSAIEKSLKRAITELARVRS